MNMLFSETELNSLKKYPLPKHIAIITDGNRRWAKKEKRLAWEGHKEGAENLIRIVKAASQLGIKWISSFAFSTENWQRAPEEIDALMCLFETYLREKREEMVEEGVALQFIGDLSSLPESVQKAYRESHEITKNGTNITLVVGMNYGSRNEIIRSIKKVLRDRPRDLDEKLFSSYLDTSLFPDPDMVIRTGGEKRLSNFLLWQSSYSEIFFIDKHWPEFSHKDLLACVQEFQNRTRRWGGDFHE